MRGEIVNPNGDNELEQISELIADLNKKIVRDPTLKCILKDGYDNLLEQFKELDTSIYNHQKTSVDSNDRLDVLTDAMASMADLDFSKVLKVRGDMDHLDYIALSYNLLRDRLEDKFQYSRGKFIINSFQDLYLITDSQGMVIEINQALEGKFNIARANLIGKSINSFFNLEAINKRFGIHFDVQLSRFDITRKYVANEHAKFILKVTNGSFSYHEEREDGYWYKIESFSSALYNHNTIKDREYILVCLEKLHAQIKRNIENSKERKEILNEVKEIGKDIKLLGGFESRILKLLGSLLYL
ncbi:MAG: hypothetical protein HRT71_14265 [Flavobacteriales bacterium]|nr:hypothetical protein [Flavobacteriales bacterium]